MTWRPLTARWFQLVTVHRDLALVLERLARTGAVELEASSQIASSLLFPDWDDELKAHADLARRYQHLWPLPTASVVPPSTDLGPALKAARARLVAWVAEADPIVARLEQLSRENGEIAELSAALEAAGGDFPDIARLSAAGPKLRARLLVFPTPAALLHEWPTPVIAKTWRASERAYALIVGRAADVVRLEARLPALKGAVVPLLPGLPATISDALDLLAQRAANNAEESKALQAQIAALSERLEIADALGRIALINWLNTHARDLRGGERLAWITGWTSDASGAALRKTLDAAQARYVLGFPEPPQGAAPPQVLHNPGWARGFEVFARMLGVPGQYEADPSQILAFIASLLFGFMFGDVGQGALLCILGLWLGRKYPMMRMLTLGGIAAMIFGVAFGSVFCRDDIIEAVWVRPMAEPVSVLAASITIGAGVIMIGLVLDAVQMHWRGEALRWWGQRVGLLVSYVGVLLAPFWAGALVVSAVGAGWYLIGGGVFAREGRLAAFGVAAATLVEQLLQILVNTISFARVGAFAIAHAGLSLAIMEIAHASGATGYWIVLVLGNLLVMALEGVVVSIQTTRLLLFEFFIRFLTGAGRVFNPLAPPSFAEGASTAAKT